MELAVDEFIVDWHLSNLDDQRQTAESIIRSVKRKCHRLVFDSTYLGRFAEKIGMIERARKGDTYVTLVLIKRLRTLIHDSSKIRTCSGTGVPELESIEDDTDRLVVKSALGVGGEKKILVTTDSHLLDKAKILEKYGIRILMPTDAEELLQ